MNSFVFSLGTNIGDRHAQLIRAKANISEKIGTIIRQSSVYETAAWGLEKQAAFYNQVITGLTSLSAVDTMQMILEIEAAMGRERLIKWSPRVIDIDILFFRDDIIDTENLHVPHPMFHLRRFNLVPLAELLPDFVDPRSGKSMMRLLEELEDKLDVIKLT